MARKADAIRKWEVESWSNPPASAVEATKKYYSDDFQAYDAEGIVIGDKADHRQKVRNTGGQNHVYS
jgi:hypothetical protein